MKRTLLSIAFAAASLAGALPAVAATGDAAPVHASAYAVPDPATQIRSWVRLFRNSDVTGLAQALLPPSQWQQFCDEYERHQLEPLDDDERAHFAETLERFTAPDAVDRLMLEIEPKLVEARAQLPGAMLMGFGALSMAIESPDSELTDEQRESLRQAMPGLQQWAASTDFLSSDTMRRALDLITSAARSTGIDSLDTLRALPVEQALDRAGPMLSAAKQAVRLYGIDLDAIADSLQVETLAIDGDTARVRTTVTLFGAPVSVEHELVLVEGRWYGKHAVVQLHDELAMTD